jgi:hypothetical protein
MGYVVFLTNWIKVPQTGTPHIVMLIKSTLAFQGQYKNMHHKNRYKTIRDGIINFYICALNYNGAKSAVLRMADAWSWKLEERRWGLENAWGSLCEKCGVDNQHFRLKTTADWTDNLKFNKG